ncbi:MAG: hypothetical protein ABIK62_04025, partial [candidate division WOR-3 bacterium]
SALEGDILDSRLARPFVRLAPAIYDLADRWNIEIPQLSRRAIAFEDEGKVGQDIFADRIRYSKLSGATCIECGSPVEFLGYRLRQGLAVSPLFRCPVCGRTSDGCQTFEGFHRMYYHCPYEVARGRVAIDCGVWPNRRPVQPKGKCPVCGREGK